jgi:predicted NBD/HSP70 family sugar kinase
MKISGTDDYILGIDLGGTTVSVAPVSYDGRVGETVEELLHAELGPEAGIQKITAIMKKNH